MFCNYCGNPIPDYANTCPYCGHVKIVRRRRIDTIFSSLMNDRTPGTVAEFVLWCSVCVMVILSLLAAVFVDDKLSPLDGGFRTLWIFFMIFETGLGVLMAFRLRTIAMLYAALVFHFIMLIPYYVTNTGMIDKATDHVPGPVTALFVIGLMTGAGLVVCSVVQFFSQFQLGRVAAVLSMVSTGLNMVMVFCLYFLPGVEKKTYSQMLDRTIEEFVRLNNSEGYSYAGFWLGSIAFIGSCLITALFFMLFFMGCIDSRNDKIYVAQGITGMVQAPANSFMPGLQCIQGAYAGQNIYLQGAEMTFGSQAGVHIIIQDPYISHRHCSIRFNPAAGVYEILDVSTNGVYLNNGIRLQKGVYNPCQRGSVICLGSTGQQFRLL